MVCSPPENRDMGFFLSSFANPSPVNSLSYSCSYSNRSRSKLSLKGQDSISSSSTVRCSSAKTCWDSIPVTTFLEHKIPGPILLSSRSSGIVPAITFNNVVLPAPFFPTTAIFSVPCISKSMWDRMTFPPADTVPSFIWYNMSLSCFFPIRRPRA